MPDKPTYKELQQRIEELEEESSTRRALADAPFEAVFLSEKGKCLDQNQASEKMFGYTRGEAVGMHCTEWIVPEDRELVKVNMESGNEKPYEVVALRKDGTTFPCEIQARTAHYDGRSIIVTALRDITERKAAEEILRNEVVLRRILVEQSRDGIVVVDQDGKVYEANQRFVEMLGYTMEETLQLYVWDWDTQWSKEELKRMIDMVDEAGDHFETTHRGKDGNVYDVEISTNGAEYMGKKFIFCVCRDVTDRKQTERERDDLIDELQKAISEVKILRGIIPMCSYCKKIRDDKGYWQRVEKYIQDRSDALFSHGYCDECQKKYFPKTVDEQQEQ